MSQLDDALREALRREEPPVDFTARVMARLGAPRPKVNRWEALLAALRTSLRTPALRWAAVSVLGLLVVFGFQYHRERQLRAQGELAREQVILALRITGNKLQIAQAKVYSLQFRAATVRERTQED